MRERKTVTERERAKVKPSVTGNYGYRLIFWRAIEQNVYNSTRFIR
jgi:hypothetical protein